MSRRDDLHLSLRHTLEKEGWKITDDPLILTLEKTLLKADLGAEKFFAAEKEDRKIALEIKDFDTPSVISELEKTRGQLQLYKWALDSQEPERKLFLGISQAVYLKHFKKAIFQLVIKRNKINLIIYNPQKEIIVEWITQ